MNINQRVQEMLTNCKLTQKELSAYISVAPSTLNNWIKLGRSIPAEYIIPICEFFNVSLEYLLTGNENQTTILTTDEQELLENYRHLAPDSKEEASKRVQELTTHDISIKEYETDHLISRSSISKMNGYENRLLNAFRMLSYEEQIELTARAETMSEKSKAEENAG